MGDVVYECGDLRVDPANRRLTRGATEVALEPKAFAVLLVLLARADELVTRDQLLDAVWGHRHVTPATLNRVMVLLRRAFDDPDHPRFIETVHGAGYRFVGAVQCVAVPRDQIRAHFGPPPIAQLPTRLEPLIGRERELAQLRTMLSEHRALTVIGPGGMGKTQCSLEVGRQCEADFPDGVWFFDLSPFERTQDWVRALAGTLSVPTAGTPTLLEGPTERRHQLKLDRTGESRTLQRGSDLPIEVLFGPRAGRSHQRCNAGNGNAQVTDTLQT